MCLKVVDTRRGPENILTTRSLRFLLRLGSFYKTERRLYLRLRPSILERCDSLASLFAFSRIERSSRNSICLFSERCSRSASSANFALRLAGMRNKRRTVGSLMTQEYYWSKNSSQLTKQWSL